MKIVVKPEEQQERYASLPENREVFSLSSCYKTTSGAARGSSHLSSLVMAKALFQKTKKNKQKEHERRKMRLS